MIDLILPVAVSIVEILPNPEGQDLGNEYVIVENTYGEELYLDDREGESPPYKIDEETLYSDETGISLNNDGDIVRILDENFQEIISLEIPEALEGVKYPMSFSSPTSIRITEIMPNPEEEETTQEWIEIQNTGSETINIGGLLLDDAEEGSSPYTISSTEIPAGGYTLVYRSESGIGLNNSDDAARILSADGKVLDEVDYSTTKEGKSYQLVGDEWKWAEPSPGTANIVLAKVNAPSEEPTTVVIENAEESLYQKLLPYIVTLLAVAILSLYEYKKAPPKRGS